MDSRTTKTMSPETKSPANQDPPPAGQRGSLSVIAGSAFPTYAEMHKALDDLHNVCECATMPDVETWYRGDAFAKEARQRALAMLEAVQIRDPERVFDLYPHEVSGGMGQRAQELFAVQGIQVVVGAPSETPEKLVADFLAGSLKTGDNACDH